MSSLSVYSQYKPQSKQINFFTGARFSTIVLNADFNTNHSLGLPVSSIQINNDALTTSFGLKWSINKSWESSLVLSTGF